MSGTGHEAPPANFITTDHPLTIRYLTEYARDPIAEAYGDRAPGSGGRWLAQRAEREWAADNEAWRELCREVDFEDWLLDQQAAVIA
jgi:hypothetical protein